MYKTLSSKTVYKNEWIEVLEDEIEFPTGKKGIYGYVKRKNGAFILVVNPQNEVLLVKQYRYPIQQYKWNLPGGGIEKGEDPAAGAIREVYEETGIKVDKVEKVGSFFPLSSHTTENVSLFWSRVGDVKIQATTHEKNESFDEKVFVPLEKCLKMIDDGEINDAFTCSALQILARRIK